MKKELDYFYGCLIGGAIGDALGAPVEFMQYDKIQDKYGDTGIRKFTFPIDEHKALITDDTQMTLFTAEGLLRNINRNKNKCLEKTSRNTTLIVFRAYLRWLYTQGLKTPNWEKKNYDGWLVNIPRLHAYREPGVTCITTLGKGIMGTEVAPINESKSCGGVMRVAPVGLIEEDAFDIGAHTAAITHGHPTAYLAAGTMAAIVKFIIDGDALKQAILKAIEILKTKEQHEECLELIEKAIELVEQGMPTREKLQTLGGGFLAHEALAIAIYAALSYSDDFEKAIVLAVNHNGDSDTTGALTGNLLGAYLGAKAINKEFIEQVELSKEIYELAKDLLTQYEDSEAWQQKYPVW